MPKGKRKSGKGWKGRLRKVWWFIWEDDSLLSWVINVAIAFVLIKYLVYPGLGFVLGTSFPVVAVVSGSMEHDGNFDEWWNSPAVCRSACTQKDWYNERGITREEFTNFIFKNGFNKGDIIILFGAEPQDIHIGDVIVFNAGEAYPIIHRVVSIEKKGDSYVFETKGDHNMLKGQADMNIQQEQILGRAVVRIPYLGWIKIGAFEAVDWVLVKIGIKSQTG